MQIFLKFIQMYTVVVKACYLLLNRMLIKTESFTISYFILNFYYNYSDILDQRLSSVRVRSVNCG